ncbi:MAG: hypothetical protein ACRC46_07315 [Thermoguttaceae bacterium]
MDKEPASEYVSEMLKKLESEPVAKPFSWLRVLTTVFLVLLAVPLIFFTLFPLFFFANFAPKQADVDCANEAIQRINAQMDEFENALQPLRERIEKLDAR